MKRLLLPALLFAAFLSGCMKDTVIEHYTFYRPVYWTRNEIMNNIKSSAPVAIEQPGKIVVRGNYVFLNEVDRGIHIIDITQPAQPVNMAFIDIAGCVDLAVYGNYLYADCYTNLVTIDITDPKQIVLKQMLDSVFPDRSYTGFVPDKSRLIKEWVRVDTAVSREFSESFARSGKALMMASSGFAQTYSAALSSPTIGIAGSLARFAIQNDRMYAVSNTKLRVFNLTSPAMPASMSTASVGSNIETIFPYKDKLFIGSQNGMFIYTTTNPDQPKLFGQFTHARSCDPVIVDDTYAYVTLSGGSACGGFSNQLDVVNITNLQNPVLLKTYPLTGPRGLSKDGNLLLICDGKAGLKIFDATNASQITLVKTLPGITPTDVIALQGTAIAVANDGLYFIDYTNPANAFVMSKLQLVKAK